MWNLFNILMKNSPFCCVNCMVGFMNDMFCWMLAWVFLQKNLQTTPFILHVFFFLLNVHGDPLGYIHKG
jgi:hypothetical protein